MTRDSSGTRREREHLAERLRVEAGRPAECDGRVHVGRDNDHPPLVERRLHFPAKPEREVGGVEQDQRPRRRQARRRPRPPSARRISRTRPTPTQPRGVSGSRARALRAAVSTASPLTPSIAISVPRRRLDHWSRFLAASHSPNASAFQSDHGRCSHSRNIRRIAWCCSPMVCSASTVMKLKMRASESYSRMTRVMNRW